MGFGFSWRSPGAKAFVAAFFLALALVGAGQARRTVDIVALHTNDEHGWILPEKGGGGLAEMMTLWKRNEGVPNPSALILSGGDQWTGPALSSQSKGAAMVAAMNAMGYRAAAIGNHEFDSGLSVLRKNRAAATFSFLSANIVERAGGRVPDFAAPYAIFDVSGVKVGVIGLTTRETPVCALPTLVKDFDFGDYQAATRTAAAAARRDGAVVLIVLGHVAFSEMEKLATETRDLAIPLMFAGHDHRAASKRVGDTWIVESGSCARSYSRVDLRVDPTDGRVEDVKVKLVRNNPEKTLPDPTVKAVVDKWRREAGGELDKAIGWSKTGVARPKPAHDLATRAWLWAFPDIDVALCNVGAFRQDIDAGEITVGDVVGVLPFNNTLYEVRLSGADLLKDLDLKQLTAGGVVRSKTGWLLTKTGKPVDPAASYRVLVNSFMYFGGDSCPFQRQDPNGRDTKVAFRQPLIDWIAALKTSPEKPLESVLKNESRGP